MTILKQGAQKIIKRSRKQEENPGARQKINKEQVAEKKLKGARK